MTEKRTQYIRCPDHTHCIEQALQTADTLCRDKGLRFTKLRKKIFTLIWHDHSPAKAYDILDKLQVDTYKAKPPTVYRTLDFLLECGLIHKLNSLNAYIGCSHPLAHHECYFLICDQCGEITECCDGTLMQAVTETTNQYQFKPQHTTLEIKGTCHKCRNHLS